MENIILPMEIVNKILIMRPKHPIAKILEKRIKECHMFLETMRPDYDPDYVFRNYFYTTSFPCFGFNNFQPDIEEILEKLGIRLVGGKLFLKK